VCRVWCSGRPTHENRRHKGTYKRQGNILKISGDQSFTLTMEGDIPASGRLHGAIHLVDRDDGDDDDRFCWLNG